ncbi:hypothetical protein KGF54_002228 [Candida jiufengensis]|uniref:uncharacterized protein n=1 Tax=Candida jiufengensis TaxID=497108 RepID=UPI00222530D2|nr:uncharacterized protein KGF54_002228 [Candida jiufengensis]KAI5954453.1 hypothetical protein KGF54_002228 [Candida jiufengensis]
MSDIEQIDHIQPEQDELDNPMRIILVTDHNQTSTEEEEESKDEKITKETKYQVENEMEEILLDQIQTFTHMNEFFDSFDSDIAYPNEGHIKYEVGSDGLVVIIVDSKKLKDEVMKFIEKYDLDCEEVKKDEEEQSSKKKRKD